MKGTLLDQAHHSSLPKPTEFHGGGITTVAPPPSQPLGPAAPRLPSLRLPAREPEWKARRAGSLRSSKRSSRSHLDRSRWEGSAHTRRSNHNAGYMEYAMQRLTLPPRRARGLPHPLGGGAPLYGDGRDTGPRSRMASGTGTEETPHSAPPPSIPSPSPCRRSPRTTSEECHLMFSPLERRCFARMNAMPYVAPETVGCPYSAPPFAIISIDVSCIVETMKKSYPNQ